MQVVITEGETPVATLVQIVPRRFIIGLLEGKLEGGVPDLFEPSAENG